MIFRGDDYMSSQADIDSAGSGYVEFSAFGRCLFDKWRMRATKKHKENDYEHARADAEDVEFPAVSRIGGSYVLGWPPPLRAKCVQDHQ
jgi:hypothetical protein